MRQLTPGNLIIVSVLEMVMPEGTTIKRSEWPYHSTVLPWSDVKHPVAERALEECAQTFAPFMVNVGESMYFGPNKDIHVNILEDQTQLAEIHNFLTDHVGDVEFVEPQYINAGYRAHITKQPSADYEMRVGQRLRITGLSLAELIDQGTVRVLKNYTLRVADEQAKA